MSQKFIRVYQKHDIHSVTQHLLVYGDLSGQCAACQTVDIKLDAEKCPSCGAEFKFIAFRNVKSHLPKMLRLSESRQVTFIDHDDYQRVLGAVKAEEFLK